MKRLFIYLSLASVFFALLFSCNELGGGDSAKQTRSPNNDIVATTRSEDSISMGRILFKNNCATCHAMGGIIEGPSLKGIMESVPQPSAEWLRKFIKNNVALIKSGDAYAKKLFVENNNVAMPAFDTVLNDTQINYIILFLKSPPK